MVRLGRKGRPNTVSTSSSLIPVRQKGHDGGVARPHASSRSIHLIRHALQLRWRQTDRVMDDVGDVDRSSSQHSGHVKGDDGAEFDWFSRCKDVPPASSAEAIVFVYNYLVAVVVGGSVSVGGEGTCIRLPYVARPTANASLLQRREELIEDGPRLPSPVAIPPMLRRREHQPVRNRV